MPPPSDGGSILPPAYEPLREVIGDFEIVAKLGQGGMGAVYRARQVSLDRQVALKLLPAHMLGDADSVARFRREARVAASLTHANLVAVYAAGEADGCHFIAMELIEGEDLGRRLKRGETLTAPEALHLCAEVARGLEHGWRSAQLIHRDIKPANIFLSANGAVKLGDLGLAKSLLGDTTGLTQTGAMMGTPQYMSPEQARGDREIDFRADIYSLGCTLYHMLTGHAPYRGTDAITIIRQHLDAPLPAILKVWPQCPVPLARLVGRMLKKARHERPASYADLLGQIDSVWAQIDPVGHSPEAFAAPQGEAEVKVPAPSDSTPLAAPPRAPRSKGMLYGAIAAGGLVLAAFAFAFWPKVEPLTKAQIIAAQRAAAAGASGTQTPDDGGTGKAAGDKIPPSTPALAAAPATYPQPRVWIDDTESVRWHLKRGAMVADGDWLAATAHVYATLGGGKSFRDAAVRVVYSGHIGILLRKTNQQYWAEAWKSASIRIYDTAAQKSTYLKDSIDLGPGFAPDAEHELVFAAQGDQLSLWLDGKELASVRGATLPAGRMDLVMLKDARPAPRIKKVEYAELEPARAPTPAAAPLSPSAESWRNALDDPAVARSLTRTPEGARMKGHISLPAESADGAVRLRSVFRADGGLNINVRANGEREYRLAIFGGSSPSLWLQRKDSLSKFVALDKKALAPIPRVGEIVEMELRIVGKSIIGKWQGVELLRAEDDAITEAAAITVTFAGDPVDVRSFDILNLGTAPGAPAAAK